MEGMSLIVKTVTRWVISLIMVFGAAIILFGHLTPGGGFAGGVIMAAGLTLWILAFGGRGRHKLAHKAASTLDVVGAVGFLALALTGLGVGVFFLNFMDKGTPFTLVSAGSIVPMNIAVGLKVSASLLLAFLLLAALRIQNPGSDESAISSLEEQE